MSASLYFHENAWSSYARLLHEPEWPLYIGGAYLQRLFSGYVDDLTLWNRSISQEEIRALNYLDRGLNAIVVPRGLFFNSQFFASLNSSDYSAFGLGNPLIGSMMMGNDNPLELNARVVQQLIAANLTLAEAWTWILKLQRNSTLKNTSFPLVVTSEVYTIGFDPALMNVLPNMTVENSGNYSVPPPPARRPSYWERVWNSFTGLVSSVWNAVVAVCTFVANVALAVVKWGMGLAVAIATGQGLQYIYDTVVKPFVELVLWFIRWILDLVTAAIRAIADTVLRPALAGMNRAAQRIASAMLSALNVAADMGNAVASAFVENMPIFVVVASIIVLVVAGIGYVINIFPFIGVAIAAVFSTVLMASLIAMIPHEEPASNPDNVRTFLEGINTKYGSALFLSGLLDVSLGKFAVLGEKGAEGVDPAIPVLKAFVFALAAFMVGGYAQACEGGGLGGACAAGILSLWFSGMAIALSIVALLSASKALSIGQKIGYWIFGGVMMAASTLTFLGDTGFVLKHCS